MMLLAVVLPSVALADGTPKNKNPLRETPQQEKPQQRKNLEIITDNKDILEYTYEKNGDVYKVVEHIGEVEDITTVNSDIYKKENGKFVLVSEKLTHVNAKEKTVTTQDTDKNGSKSFNEMDIKKSIDDIKPNFIENDDMNSVFSTDPGGGSAFDYLGTYRYSDRLKNLTLAGIRSVVATSLGAINIGYAIAANLANTVYSMGVETLYYTEKAYVALYPNGVKKADKSKLWVYHDRYRGYLVDPKGTSYPIYGIKYY